MKQLQVETNAPASAEECAELLLDTVPIIMSTIRLQRRHGAHIGLSLPHFRVLLFIGRHPGSSLSRVAEEIGLTLPSMSRIVDALVERGLVARGESPSDRRCLTLSLTSGGESALTSSRVHAQAHLAGLLSALPTSEVAEVATAMRRLHAVFSSARCTGGKVSA